MLDARYLMLDEEETAASGNSSIKDPVSRLCPVGVCFYSSLAILPVPMSILINFLLVTYVVVALLMVFVILMQRPRSEGLGAAFGGGVTENIFGAQTTNVLVKFTAWLAAIFFAITFVLSILYAHKTTGDSALRRELLKTQNAPQGSAPTAAQNSPAPSVAPSAAAPAASVPARAVAPFSGEGELHAEVVEESRFNKESVLREGF